MSQYLVITAVGTDRPGICNQVVQLVTASDCNIVDSRIAQFGNEFTLIMLLSGSTNSIARVETNLPILGQEQDLITIMKRTLPHLAQTHCHSVDIYIESDDRQGLTEQFTRFFADRDIGLDSLSAQTISGDKLKRDKDQFQISMSATLGPDHNLMQLQEEFYQLCQTLSVHGSLNFITNP